MERVHVVGEGAGATPVAAALAAATAGARGFGPDDVVVCVVSGGCIGLDTVAGLLAGRRRAFTCEPPDTGRTREWARTGPILGDGYDGGLT
jgi:threonine dehydratase